MSAASTIDITVQGMTCGGCASKVRTALTATEATVTVRDEGAGFPKADMGRLTRRFVRGSNTESVVGSGLGLTIAHEVASAHGGRLFLTNHNEEGGACASLSFPLA